MKSIISLLVFCTISFSPARCQVPLSAKQRDVQNTVLQLFEALSTRDSVGLKATCTSDILLIEYGRVWTLDTLITRAIKLNQSTDFKRVNTIDFIHTTVDKNIASATYNNQAEITREGTQRSMKWIETVVLVKEKKLWKIKVLHSTLIKRT